MKYHYKTKDINQKCLFFHYYIYVYNKSALKQKLVGLVFVILNGLINLLTLASHNEICSVQIILESE